MHLARYLIGHAIGVLAIALSIPATALTWLALGLGMLADSILED